MRYRRVLGRRILGLGLLAPLILALPLMPVRAVPCDGYALDEAALIRRFIRVVVVADQAWQEAYGGLAETRARQLITEADRILESSGIDLRMTDYGTWATRGAEHSMSEMLKGLESAVPAQPGELVLGLTGRQISRVDGIAHVRHVHLVARRHPDRPQYDALVLAHEIGHLLGAEHHDCDHAYRCVMAPKGFGLPARWCGHHVLEIQRHAAHLSAQ